VETDLILATFKANSFANTMQVAKGFSPVNQGLTVLYMELIDEKQRVEIL
jgi:hypothetical protein